MTGHGEALGAVTVLNATATGIGCALAIRGPTPVMQADWTWSDAPDMRLEGAPDDRLGRAVLHILRDDLDAPPGARVAMRSAVPPARGLKSSSAAAAAMVRAALDALGPGSMDKAQRAAVDVVDLAVRACIDAGVTLTGAYDDQVAVVLGGCRLTDNLQRRDLGALPVRHDHVAVWVPDAAIDKSGLRHVALDAVVPAAREAERLARAGDVAAAMTRNGEAFHAAYRDAGLPVDDAPVRAALDAGAAGAGLSGTGPAVAALFEAPVDLPPVPGGAWTWWEVAHG